MRVKGVAGLDHGVEDGQHFIDAGNDRALVGFAGIALPAAEVGLDGVEAIAGLGGHVEGLAQLCPPAGVAACA